MVTGALFLQAASTSALAQSEQDVLRWIKLIPEPKKKALEKPVPAPVAAAKPADPVKPDTAIKTTASTALVPVPAVPAPITEAPPSTTPSLQIPLEQAALAPPSAVAPVAATDAAPPAPVALKMLYSEMPQIPKRAARQGIANGSVVATFTIHADGSVSDVSLASARPSEFNDAAIAATIATWRFAPIPEDQHASIELVFKP